MITAPESRKKQKDRIENEQRELLCRINKDIEKTVNETNLNSVSVFERLPDTIIMDLQIRGFQVEKQPASPRDDSFYIISW